MLINKILRRREEPIGEIAKTNVQEIEISSIRLIFPPLPTQDNSLIALADNIRKCGLTEPIKVYYDGSNYYLLAGARRVAAHRLLGKQFILAKIYEDASVADTVLIAENVLAQGKSALVAAQIAKYYCDIRRFPASRIANMMEMSAADLEKLLFIANLPREDTRRLFCSELSNSEIYSISEISNASIRERVISKLYNERNRLDHVISEARQEKNRPKFYAGGLVDNSFRRLVSQISNIGRTARLEKTESDGDVVYTVKISR